MYHATGAEALFRTFRDRSDENWLDILVSSLHVPDIEGVPMPGFPPEELQRLDVPVWPPDQAAIGPAGFGQAAGVQRSPMT